MFVGILKRRALEGASHTSPGQVRGAIDAFVATYNETAAQFERQKREIRQVGSARIMQTSATEAPALQLSGASAPSTGVPVR